MSEDAKPLRLLAQDEDDLKVISAACQDAVFKTADIKFSKAQRRFHIEINRFCWEDRESKGKKPWRRARAVLSFEGVLMAKSRNLPSPSSDAVSSLLSVTFEADAEPPGGVLRLSMAGQGDLALTAECLDVTLVDTGPEWATGNRPDHDID